MMKREPAWRLLSGEFNATRIILRSNGSKEPNYALTPLGAKVNRVFIVGKAIEMEDLGTDARSFYRIKMTDPTGVFYLAVGEYQPEALGSIRDIELPSHLAVVGKVKSYEPESGGLYLSIRPEFIYPTTAEFRDYWLYSAVQSLQSRIEAVTEASKMTKPTIEQIKSLGYPTHVAEGIIEALERYGVISFEQFQVIVKDALQHLVNPNGFSESTDNDHKSSGAPMKPSTPHLKKGLEKDKIERSIMDIFKSNIYSRNLGINWNDLLSEIKKKKIERGIAEQIIREQMDKGVLYEPIIGVIKKITG